MSSDTKKATFVNYFSWICSNFKLTSNGEDEYFYVEKSNEIKIDLKAKKWSFLGAKSDRNTVWNLNLEENIITMILVLKLLQAGYSKENIILEKSFALGHQKKSGYVDIWLHKDKKQIICIEVKTSKEINNYLNVNGKQIRQLFTYIFQEKNIKIASYYSFDLTSKSDCFYNVEVDDNLKNALNPEDLFDKWNKIFNEKNLLYYKPFDIRIDEKKYKDLKEITVKDSKILFNQFLTILRINAISDKSNAFDKIINLFIAKVFDELGEDKEFSIKSKNDIIVKFEGLKFQHLEGVDTDESFMKRLYDLYKEGMQEYLKKEIIDYSDPEIEITLNSKKSQKILKMIDNLRLKKDNTFAFIEVFDDKTFEENCLIVKEVVGLFANFKFRYNTKSKSLGEFFEDLLNTSLKQEAGQFFTPYPIVDFMINSLPISNIIKKNIQQNKNEILPFFIDYACGSGHFLISYMNRIQQELDNWETKEITNNSVKNKLNSYKTAKFFWVKDYVFGIEKDYRLAKTAKISLFLNGDGEAQILHADGINKFSCEDYSKTILFSNEKKNEKFDFVVSNPPYSVQGYMKNFARNNISEKDGYFELLEEINEKDARIEIMFVERTYQLLKKDRFAAIILPQSFLSQEKYAKTRKWLLERFNILSMFCSADNTFGYTTTSPCILFLRKKSQISKHLDEDLNYKVFLINSPKMFLVSKNTKEVLSKEREFLGYEFSQSRNKSGIKILNDNLVKKYSNQVNEFFLNQEADYNDDNSRTTSISNVILKDEKKNLVIYPRYKKPEQDKKGFYLKDFCSINNNDFDENHAKSLNYIEISNIQNNEITGSFKKGKKNYRIARKGDILISSLTPSSRKVVLLTDKDYRVSKAIHVLRFGSNYVYRDYVYKYLLENRNNVFEICNSLLDGFKITYSKINEFNLMNYVWIQDDGSLDEDLANKNSALSS
ncbi:HsdM family class I SAM-dependent methyltransferase [endosymbiont GvMRE of Glomus versiforme]|uniref:HsdM family class I SAM-dependent methyltransferase n=1 Tax=endosymbiont GvMRE of Glomus versiforme TaxID=2039283 RepID=UPI000EED943F|nr:N-6 DNA methylase [endosymbiont GvMRE of Glomus versiforme]RHZ36790.1 Type I restriction-modification system, M subunit [endosymbiont GvMRE of Glomus versiforme]